MVEPSRRVSNIEGKRVVCGLFAGRSFENGQIIIIYIREPCGESEVSDYVIKNNCDIKLMKLNVEGGYPEVK